MDDLIGTSDPDELKFSHFENAFATLYAYFCSEFSTLTAHFETKFPTPHPDFQTILGPWYSQRVDLAADSHARIGRVAEPGAVGEVGLPGEDYDGRVDRLCITQQRHGRVFRGLSRCSPEAQSVTRGQSNKAPGGG